MKHNRISIILLLLVVLLTRAQVFAQETPRIYLAFATPQEEPWPMVLLGACQSLEREGLIDCEENDNIGYTGEMETYLREAAESGYDIIIGDAFGNEDLVRRVSADYPEVAFVFGGEGGPGVNLGIFDNWLQQAAFVNGYLAALMAGDECVIGTVAAMDIAEVNRIVNAFIDGGQYARNDCTFLTTFIGGWFLPDVAADAAQAQVDAGATVIFGERFGAHSAAIENDVWFIGMMTDQRELCEHCTLSSVTWDMTAVFRAIVEEVNAGLWHPRDYGFDINLANGSANVAPLLVATIVDSEGNPVPTEELHPLLRNPISPETLEFLTTSGREPIPPEVAFQVIEVYDAIVAGTLRVAINEDAPPSRLEPTEH